MAYDHIFSASRSSSRNVQRKNNQHMKLKGVKSWLTRATKKYVRINYDLTKNHSEIVRIELCSECSINSPEWCEDKTDKNHMYFCQQLSREYNAFVRLYLPSKKSNPNPSHHRAHKAMEIEDLIKEEPGIRRSRILEKITGRDQTIIDILENDLVFQGRVKRTEHREKGKPVFQYNIVTESPASIPEIHEYISESVGGYP